MEDTGTTHHVEQPTPTEQEARAAQRVFNRYRHLPPGEHRRLVLESADQMFEGREINPHPLREYLYVGLSESERNIPFLPTNTRSELLNQARERLNDFDNPNLPVWQPGILARPGTAAREAQERRMVRMRNFFTHGVM